MSVKIKVSYNTDEELAGVLRLLSPWVKSYKVSRKQKGKFKNAYVEFLDTVTRTHEKPDIEFVDTVTRARKPNKT